MGGGGGGSSGGFRVFEMMEVCTSGVGQRSQRDPRVQGLCITRKDRL